MLFKNLKFNFMVPVRSRLPIPDGVFVQKSQFQSVVFGAFGNLKFCFWFLNRFGNLIFHSGSDRGLKISFSFRKWYPTAEIIRNLHKTFIVRVGILHNNSVKIPSPV